MCGRKGYMKLLLTICLLLILAPPIASAQQRGKHPGTLNRTQTREAERLLSELGYWTGPVDGIFDQGTRSALIAFQKWENRPITGQLTFEELEAIRGGSAPRARELGYE